MIEVVIHLFIKSFIQHSLLPVRWQDLLRFVVACKPMNATFYKNQTELGVFVLKQMPMHSFIQPNSTFTVDSCTVQQICIDRLTSYLSSNEMASLTMVKDYIKVKR